MQTKPFELVTATVSMLEKINDIYLESREMLVAKGIFQWDDEYPNKEYFKYCIYNKELYVLLDKEEILGHVVLNEWQSEEWAPIIWLGKNPLMVHSLMINPLVRGRGLGSELIKLYEQLALEKGYDSIRLDAFSGNQTALHLYTKLGYQKRGSIYFTSKPEGHQEYVCFEKALV